VPSKALEITHEMKIIQKKIVNIRAIVVVIRHVEAAKNFRKEDFHLNNIVQVSLLLNDVYKCFHL
jgi:hypothetical protein